MRSLPRTVKSLAVTLLALAAPTSCTRQLTDVPASMFSWNRPAEPFRIAGNVYFVGTSGMGVYFIPTPAGHILIDTAFEASVPRMVENVRRLGFRFEDTKILLASHAHIDHVGGHARVRELTGARVLISQGDERLLREGGLRDFAYGDSLAFRGCPVDGIVHDGDRIELGGTVLTARLTPGHTPGATTWTMPVQEQGRSLQVVFFPSGNVSPGARLKNNPSYPEIVSDFEASFARWKAMPCDVFLGAHTSFFDLPGKYRRLKAGGPNPFIDPEGFRRVVAEAERKFRDQLEHE